MRLTGLFGLCTSLAFVIGAASTALAQSREPEPETRQTIIVNAVEEKAQDLHPYEVTRAEKVFTYLERRVHRPGRDVASRSSKTRTAAAASRSAPATCPSQRLQHARRARQLHHPVYKRVEAEFTAPRLFHRRGELSLLGGWREATQVGFYGIGMNTSNDDRANFDFRAAVRIGAADVLADAPVC